ATSSVSASSACPASDRTVVRFLPTDEQLELQRGVRDLLAARWPLDRVGDGFDRQLWSELAATGVFSLRSDLGLGLAESVLVFEELGRAVVTGPLVATSLAAGHGADDSVVALVETERPPVLVAHLDVADRALVFTADGVWLAEPPSGQPIASPLDPLSPMSEIVAPVPDGSASVSVATGADAERLRATAAVLTAALQVGLAARLTELAVDYAKTREQFGRTIGSFQAVKHICADMFVRTELARVAVHAAAVLLDDPDADDPDANNAARAVAGAKLLADEAATGNGRSAVQVHGGMGFTWEVPVHFLLKRAWLHATEFGGADDHAEALAARL
ncbi:MAG: acyl-CoA dehydrogenase, partial [Frankiales bacterium]|nr:acyl-CoA dehydrogenase [Frankiales bacterium]